MVRDEIDRPTRFSQRRPHVGRRWRAGVSWLRHSTGQVPQLTLWGWVADGLVALVLTIGAVAGVASHTDVGDTKFRVEARPLIGLAVPPTPAPPAPDPGAVPNPDPVPNLEPVPEVPDGYKLVPFPGQLPAGEGVAWWQYGLAALTALPLALRRRYPLGSFWIIAVATVGVFRIQGVELTWTLIAAVLAAYSAPTYSRYRNLALVSVVGAAILVIANPSADLPNIPSGVFIFLSLTTVALGANVIHAWRQRAQTLQREQAAATRLALEHERARLARELHDVVGHNVAVMVVQAGAARKVLDSAPDQAREALLAVEAGGRAAMTELRQVIGLLAPDVDDADLAPQPGLAQLPVLAERIRETGVPVTLTVTGTVDGLPAGVELAAYRVVQEALTNTVKHAAGAAVTIAVARTADELRIEVTDTGGLAVAASTGGGRGLTGLRERLSAYGGTLTAARRPTGGFRVVAVTPLPADP
jgi:signal transduction histidine kinase